MGTAQGVERWPVTAADVFTGLADWRAAHPRATLQEIEQTLDERLALLRARMLEDLALASRQADVQALPVEERPVCRVCGGRGEARGVKTRRLTTTYERQITLTRSYAVCSACGTGLSPLDEELALAPGHLTPYLRESVVRLATWMSFVRAGRELAHFTGVLVGGTTVRRLTERAGAAYVAVQTAAVTLLERALPAPPEGSAVQYLSVDGAMVPLVGGVWAEVRTLALGEVVVRCQWPRTCGRSRHAATGSARSTRRTSRTFHG